MTIGTNQPRTGQSDRTRRALTFFGVAALLALLGHVGFVVMTGGSVGEAFDGEALQFFALPALLVPATVALSIAMAPASWQRTRVALVVAAVVTALHAVAVGIWIAGISYAPAQAYAVIFLAPVLLGAIVAALALVLVRPFRH